LLAEASYDGQARN